jgi:hypothetical protein
MADLLNAYQHNEINRVEKILKENKTVIMGDPFIEQFIKNILREIRTKVLLELIRPYTRVAVPFIAKVGGPSSQLFLSRFWVDLTFVSAWCSN